MTYILCVRSFDKDDCFSIFPRLLNMVSVYYLFLVKLISYVYIFNIQIYFKNTKTKIRALNAFFKDCFFIYKI